VHARQKVTDDWQTLEGIADVGWIAVAALYKLHFVKAAAINTNSSVVVGPGNGEFMSIRQLSLGAVLAAAAAVKHCTD